MAIYQALGPGDLVCIHIPGHEDHNLLGFVAFAPNKDRIVMVGTRTQLIPIHEANLILVRRKGEAL